MTRGSILATLAFVVILGIAVADFLDNGKIDNGQFLIVTLFIFSGASVGRGIEIILEKYLGMQIVRKKEGEEDEKNDADDA